jgi:hypothetical protein
MPNSLRLWSPRRPALAVYVRGNETLEWDQYLQRLGKILEDLGKRESDPANVLEREWLDQMGSPLSLSYKGVVSAVDDPAFEEMLLERHNLRREDFPMEARGQSDEGLPSNLAEWVSNAK